MKNPYTNPFGHNKMPGIKKKKQKWINQQIRIHKGENLENGDLLYKKWVLEQRELRKKNRC